MAEKMFDRMTNIQDPVVRHSILVDKLCMIIDLAMAALENYDEYFDENLQGRVDALSRDVQNELKSLLSWIQSPVHSPDHPFGQAEMKRTQGHYYNLAEKKGKNKNKSQKKGNKKGNKKANKKGNKKSRDKKKNKNRKKDKK